MKKHIAEELPARKFPQAAKKDDKEDKKGGKTPEQRVRQAVYDIRYRARREELPLQQAYSQYMANSSMPQQEKALVKQKLFGKGGMKAEDFNIQDFASDNVANALYRVFVEGVQKEEEPIVLTYMEKLETAEHKKYKVRVTDKNGRSYVRYADRTKINSLRANPNIQSVEMTGYGEPYEGEKKKGEQTARAKAGKGLDPVGREDKDIDNDGDHDKSDKYLLNRRKVRGAAIAKRKGVSEEFLGEVNDEKVNPDANRKKIDVMKGTNKVTISPSIPGSNINSPGMPSMSRSLQVAHNEMEGPFITEKAVSKAQQKFMGMVYAAKKGEKPASPEVAKAAAGMSKKEARKFAKTKHKGLPVHKEECGCDDEPKLKKKEGSVEDPREIPTKMNLVKNKFRAMGLKMSYEPSGEELVENPLAAGAALGIAAGGAALAKKAFDTAQSLRKSREQQMRKAQGLQNSYDPEGKTILEYERGDEPGEPGSSIRPGAGGRYQGDLKTLQDRIKRGDVWKNLQAPLPPVRGAKKHESKKAPKTA